MDIKEKAKEMYLAGMPLVDIARHLKKPDYAVRKWKFNGDCDNSKRDKKLIEGTHIPLAAETDKKVNISNKELSKHKKELYDIDDEGLCENRKNFCIHYIKTFNGTQAALRAGYSPKSAYAESSRLLKDDKVKRYLRKLKEQFDNEDYLDAKRVLARHKQIAFSDITDFVKLESLDDYDNDSPKIKLKDYDGIDGTLIKKVGAINYNARQMLYLSFCVYMKGVDVMINKNIYIILCLFLGCLGVHKFYAKKKLMGFIYIIISALMIFEPFVYLMLVFIFTDLLEIILIKSDKNGYIKLKSCM